MARSGDRPEYFPVLFVQPYAGNEIAVGYDTASSPTRREALQHAAATGEAIASQRITLVQETSGQFGILIFQPVFLYHSVVFLMLCCDLMYKITYYQIKVNKH